jgi:hypothetical protein
VRRRSQTARILSRSAFAVFLAAAAVLVVDVDGSGATGEAVTVASTSFAPSASAASLGISISGFGDATDLVAVVALRQSGAACSSTTTCGTLDIPIGSRTGLTLLYNHSYSSVRIGVTGTRASVIAGIQAATYAAPSSAAAGLTVTVSVVEKPSDSNFFYEPFNGHWYKKVESGSAVSWTSARGGATGETFRGLTGYLANITTSDENSFIANYTTATNVWTGGVDSGLWDANGDADGDGTINVRDLDEEGEWRWADGPEAGQKFMRELTTAGGRCPRWATDTQSCKSLYGATYTVLNSNANAWATYNGVQSEPNQYYSYANMCATGSATCTASSNNMGTSDAKWPPGENALVTNANGTLGSWNDLHQGNADLTVSNFLVEFGGVGTDSSLKASAEPTIVFTQTIDFPNPGTQTVGFALVASASSGLDVGFASSTPSVCTVSGADVEKVANGTCTVTTSQSGNATWSAAPPVTRSFTFADDPATLVTWSIDSRTQSAPAAGTASCTAGTTTSSNSGTYRTIRFRAPASGGGSCTFTPPAGVTHVEVLLVGGGGAGGYDAGGGGGGGAMVYHSALPVSGSVTITIGAGGAASSSGATWFTKTGAAGGDSSVSAGGTTLTASGGSGGKGCRWAGSICTSGAESNTGGAGGTASGGTVRSNGGNGGNGVWTSASGSCSSKSCPGNGADGALWHILGTASNFGGGGGGSGASFTAGSGGTGGGAAGTSGAGSPSAGTAGTGGGGAGGNGVAGSNGGSGTVIVRFATSMATNNAAPSVRPVFSGTNTSSGNLTAGASTSNGTIKRQYATLTSGSCGATWTTESAAITTYPDTTELVRGRCYRWTFDDGIGSSAVRPSDSGGARPTANVTSPVLLLPVAATVAAPESLPIDPSATTVDVLLRVTGGEDDVRVCLYPTAASAISGTGTAAASGLFFDVGANGTSDASASSATVSGDRSAEASVTGTRSNLNAALASVRVWGPSGPVGDGTNVLVRSVPVLSGFTTSCDPSSSSDLRPVAGGSTVIDLVLFAKRTAVRGHVALG